jgi:hypothetical protein
MSNIDQTLQPFSAMIPWGNKAAYSVACAFVQSLWLGGCRLLDSTSSGRRGRMVG